MGKWNLKQRWTNRRARKTDPHTSHEAAAALDPIRVSNVQFAIVDLLRTYGPMSDGEIAQYYRGLGHPSHSDSGLRTRRHELVDAGIVEAYSTFTNQRGRSVLRWDLVPQYREAMKAGSAEAVLVVS